MPQLTLTKRQSRNQGYDEALAKGVLPLRMMQIPAGTFLMGSPKNVFEWCQDRWQSTYHGALADGSAWLSSRDKYDSRVVRGGSFLNGPGACRAAARQPAKPDDDVSNLGFRLCCSSLVASSP